MEAKREQDDANNIDQHVDDEIEACLKLESPKSFFLFAGAGSGKTRSLKEAIDRLRESYNRKLRLSGKRIAVITYTNKACDEIKRRIDFDPLVEVSTIHSFVWMLIKGFDLDIRTWLENELQKEIADLRDKESKGRGGKASLDRLKSIESKTKRLALLPTIRKFDYNPNGNNKGHDSLNHSEVIKIAASFLIEKPTMQQILITKFPILLIDESQDTNKLLMEAFLIVQEKTSEKFALGLFGDTMQRIYADGKTDLGHNLPKNWSRPVKQMNHRCPKRVIQLINKLRSEVDDNIQKPRTDAMDGTVKLFIIDNHHPNKANAERAARQKMSSITNDEKWGTPDEVKTLILEHHMAAKRMGFFEMFEPLYRNENLRIGLLDGTLSSLKLFSRQILPLIEAKNLKDSFVVTAIIRKHSPLLIKSVLKAAGQGQLDKIKEAKIAVEELYNLWTNEHSPRFIDILRSVAKTGLFEIPESLQPIAMRTQEEQEAVEAEISGMASNNAGENSVIDNWDQFLLTSFDQLKLYVDYVDEKASFDTHQGVKGLEFPRVMIIIDDAEAKGFLFSYDKLFGVKQKTKTDLENEQAGKDTGIDRTRRLFYVTCSRAEESLAIVAYSDNPQLIKQHVITQEWFAENEVEIIPSSQ